MKQNHKKLDLLACYQAHQMLGFLGNLLTDKGVKAKILVQRIIKAGEGTVRVGQSF